ncbi:TPA: hypothetical protein L4559_005151 [Pseudomonas aeruginosa]|nr:hypothetical protein [Pseudomonas aeruginosa]
MAGKEHLKGHNSIADMVSTHIAVWREALTDTLMLKGDPDDRSFIEHELKALDDIEAALEFEMNADARDSSSADFKAENEQLREMLAQKVVDSTMLCSFTARDGGVSIGLEGGACALMAQAFAKQLYESDVVNYIEAKFESADYPGLGEIVVTLKRESGKTPHQLRIEAETASEELKRTNKALTEALAPFARYEHARSSMGGNSPKAGALWCCSHRSGDYEITVEDMQKALRLVGEHAATAL